MNKFINNFTHLIWLIVKALYGFQGLIICHIKGVKVGNNLSFYGRTRFLVRKDSSISIGSRCTFRSLPTSNRIGINRPCILSCLGSEPAKITIGTNCGFSGTVIGCFTEIRIGNDVKCGANTLITDGDWHQEDPRSGKPKQVVIEDNVWIGEGVKILKGVRIGTNSVIGAGSVVTKNIPKNVIAAGNPCKILKELSNTIDN